MDFIGIDFETANHYRSSACSVGLVKVIDNVIVDKRYYLIKPTPEYYDPINTRIHGLTLEDTATAPDFTSLWRDVLEDYIDGLPLVAHNAPFERSVFAAQPCVAQSGHAPTIYCTLSLSRYCSPHLDNYKLDTVCKGLGIEMGTHHDALCDAEACARILMHYALRFNINDFEELYTSNARALSLTTGSLFDDDKENYCVTDDVSGKHFCFTGKLHYMDRSIAEELIRDAGGIVGGMSRKINYLILGDLSAFQNNETGKVKKYRELKAKGFNIEVIDEDQLQQMIVYQGPHIEKEAIDRDSSNLLNSTLPNALSNKNILMSEKFSAEDFAQIALLGVHLGPTHYPDEVGETDYYIMDSEVERLLFEEKIKSNSVLKIESALRYQMRTAEGLEDELEWDDELDPNIMKAVHHVKFIRESAYREYLNSHKAFLSKRFDD